MVQQTLMHLYFYAILEKLQAYQYSPAQLVKMMQKTEKVCMYVLICSLQKLCPLLGTYVATCIQPSIIIISISNRTDWSSV